MEKIQLIGRLAKDPESRVTPGGDAVCNFTLAVDSSYTDKTTGDKVKRVKWIRCTAWRKTADVILKYKKKGEQVYVEGEFTAHYEDNAAGTGQEANGPKAWEAKDGTWNASYEVTIHRIEFVGNQGNGGVASNAGAPPVGGVAAKEPEDIPF